MSFKDLSLFYKNFAELYSAGIDSASTIEALKNNESRADRKLSLQLIGQNIRNGRTLFQSFKMASFVPVYDLPLVKAAEDSGRLFDIFKMLAQKHLDTDVSVKAIRISLVKPYFTLVVALLFPRFADLVAQKISIAMYLKGSLGVLGFITAVAFIFYNFWIQSFFDISKARSLHGFLSVVPFFNRLSSRMAIEKFSSTLAMMLESSIDFFEALKQSGQCSANAAIQAAVDRIIPKVNTGTNLQTAFKNEKVFPAELTTAMDLGSQSGKLPEFLNRYSRGLKEQNQSTIQTMVKFFPIALYWIIIAQIIYSIVTFYTGYLDQILNLKP